MYTGSNPSSPVEAFILKAFLSFKRKEIVSADCGKILEGTFRLEGFGERRQIYSDDMKKMAVKLNEIEKDLKRLKNVFLLCMIGEIN